PCVFPISEPDYLAQVDDVALFLQGKDDELLGRLKSRMREAATKLDYEAAAAVRDQLLALEKTLEQQRVVATTFIDQDVLGLQRGPRHDLIELACKNAEAEYASRRDHQEDAMESLGKLQRRLHLKKLPRRVECYGIANLQGQLSVGSMVVFADGVPDKS